MCELHQTQSAAINKRTNSLIASCMLNFALSNNGKLNIMFDGLSPAKKFWKIWKKLFWLYGTPLDYKFKIAWSRLSGKAKCLAKLNVTPKIAVIYTLKVNFATSISYTKY